MTHIAVASLLALAPTPPALARDQPIPIERPLPSHVAAESPAPPEPKPEPPIDPYRTRKGIYIGGGITLGFGLLQLGLGIFGAVKVREQYDAAAPACANVDPPWGCPESAIIEMNEARRDSELAALAIGFGTASVVVGTILLSVAHTAKLDFAVEPVSNGAVVTLKGAF
jgi:hypothetical protein